VHLDFSDTQEDQIVWTLESSGQYSAKSAYEIQFAGHITSNFPTLIWNAWAPPRCKFFMWLLLRGRLWTAARLQLREWENNYFCALCERSLETASHLFIECPFSRQVWSQVAEWSGCQNLWPPQWADGSDCEDWFLAVTREGTKAAHSLTILTLWCIWKQRNDVVFRGSRRTTHAVSMEVKDVCSLWSMAGGRLLRPLLDRNLLLSNQL
jgi:hypothetical protein